MITKEQKDLVLFLFIEGSDKVLANISRETKIPLPTVSKIVSEYYESKNKPKREIIVENGEHYLLIESKLNYDTEQS